MTDIHLQTDFAGKDACLKAKYNALIRNLREHHESGHISMDEFKTRVDALYEKYIAERSYL